MITISIEDGLVNAAVMGEFTLADYREFEENLLYRIRFEGRANVLLDLRDMLGFSVDVAWEEIKFSRAHSREFGRIAVVTDDQRIIWSAWLSRFFVDAEIRVFDEIDPAREWLAEAVPL